MITISLWQIVYLIVAVLVFLLVRSVSKSGQSVLSDALLSMAWPVSIPLGLYMSRKRDGK